MKTNLLMLSALLLAGLMLGCSKEETPQPMPQIVDTPIDDPDLNALFSYSKATFSESPVLFPKEGGKKTITGDGWWNLYIAFHVNNQASPFYGEAVLKEVRSITWASFGRESARQLIAPEGYICYEVEGGYPNYVSKKIPHSREKQVYEQVYKSAIMISDNNQDIYKVRATFINLFPEPEIIVQTRETGFKKFGNIPGGGNCTADMALVTSIEGEWFTFSRDWKSWFTPYEGFAYQIVPRPTTVYESLFDNLFGYNGYGGYMIGTTGSWWASKSRHIPEEFEMTLEVAPNTTGKPRSLGLSINNGCELSIYQE